MNKKKVVRFLLNHRDMLDSPIIILVYFLCNLAVAHAFFLSFPKQPYYPTVGFVADGFSNRNSLIRYGFRKPVEVGFDETIKDADVDSVFVVNNESMAVPAGIPSIVKLDIPGITFSTCGDFAFKTPPYFSSLLIKKEYLALFQTWVEKKGASESDFPDFCDYYSLSFLQLPCSRVPRRIPNLELIEKEDYTSDKNITVEKYKQIKPVWLIDC